MIKGSFFCDEDVFHRTFEKVQSEIEELLSTSKSSLSLRSQLTATLTRHSRLRLSHDKRTRLRSSTPHIDAAFPLLREVEYGFLTQKISSNFSQMVLLNAVTQLGLLTYDTSRFDFSLQKPAIGACERMFSAAELVAEHSQALAAVTYIGVDEITLYDIEREQTFLTARLNANSRATTTRMSSGFNLIALGDTLGSVQLFDLRVGGVVADRQLKTCVTALDLRGNAAVACTADCLTWIDFRVGKEKCECRQMCIELKEGVYFAENGRSKRGWGVFYARVGAKKIRRHSPQLTVPQKPLRLKSTALAAACSASTNEIAVLESADEAGGLSVNFYSQSSGKLRDQFSVPSDCYHVCYDRAGKDLICLGSERVRIYGDLNEER